MANLGAEPKHPRRNSRDDSQWWNVFRYHRAGGYNRAGAYGNTFEDHAVSANPYIRTDHNVGAVFRLLLHRDADAHAVIVIDETRSACNKAGITNFNATDHVKFTPAADKATVADEEADIPTVAAGDIQVDTVLQIAVIADRNAMWPGNPHNGQTGVASDLHSKSTPIESADRATQ